MTHIDYYFSTLSPFAYLAGDGLERIAARHGADVTYKPLDIMALFARTGGTPPAERHPSRNVYRAQELARQATKRGMALNRRAERGRRRYRGAGAKRAARVLGRGARHRRGRGGARLPRAGGL